VFNLNDEQKLASWKEFRSSLESSPSALSDVAQFWSRAPFVSNYLDPFNSKSWPDPWQLIIDSKFDDLGIALGMCYTLQLTERFKDAQFEIHMSMPESKKDRKFLLLVDGGTALNWDYGSVTDFSQIKIPLTKIWPK
jgi:hypothetical protein